MVNDEEVSPQTWMIWIDVIIYKNIMPILHNHNGVNCLNAQYYVCNNKKASAYYAGYNIQYVSDKFSIFMSLGVLCQKQELCAGTSNFIRQILWDVIICAVVDTCFWYSTLMLVRK